MFIFFLTLIGFSFSISRNSNEFQTGNENTATLTQKLDHFDALNGKTFEQRYFEDMTYYVKGGPMILYICGEGPCSGTPSFALKNYAVHLNAGVITLEHRYYGESSPFPGESLKVADLQYLSSRQALEDLAYFRTWYQTTKMSDDAKWIIMGGSYSGALSSWSRLKYPHLFNGALSSSGVVNTIYDFVEFDEQIVVSAGEECSNKLRNATNQIVNLISNPSTRNETMNKFGGASYMGEGDFLWMMADLTAVPVQYGYQKYLCESFQKVTSSVVDALAYAFTNVFVKFGLGNCDGYDIQTLLKEDNNANRMWWYQKCSEVAYFQNAPEKNSIRSSKVNVQYHLDRCERAFGLSKEIESLVEGSLWHYGSVDVFKTASNIFFVNGSQDPWKRATVQGTGPSGKLVDGKNMYFEVECDNCGHCVDMDGCPDGCDPYAPYEKVKEMILTEMQKWISE